MKYTIRVEKCRDPNHSDAYDAHVQGIPEINRERYGEVEKAVAGCVHDIVAIGSLLREHRLEIEIIRDF